MVDPPDGVGPSDPFFPSVLPSGGNFGVGPTLPYKHCRATHRMKLERRSNLSSLKPIVCSLMTQPAQDLYAYSQIVQSNAKGQSYSLNLEGLM